MRFAIRNRASIFLASLIAGVSLAHAAAPISVDGWRYVEGPNELHVYLCDQSDCVTGSRVICHFEPPNSVPFPGIWRKYEAAVSGLLNEPSKTFAPMGIVLGPGGGRGVATSLDGSKSYYEFGDVDDPKWHASLSSASSDEKASRANLERFKAALRQVGN